MQTKRLHFSPTDVWTYRVGRQNVRITNPKGKSFVMPIPNRCAEYEAGSGYVPPAYVRWYIQRHLRYHKKAIVPERGASVLLKRALLKLCPTNPNIN